MVAQVQRFDFEKFKQKSDSRKKQNEAAKVNLEGGDIYSEKAMVLIFSALFKEVLKGIDNKVEQLKIDKEKKEKVKDLLSIIDNAKNDGKDLNEAVVNNDNFREKLKDLDSVNFDRNIKDVETKLNSDNKGLRVDDILKTTSKNKSRSQKNNASNSQKQTNKKG